MRGEGAPSPVYEGEENYHGGLATPDGFDIDVRYTIPWNKVSPELQSKLGRSTPKATEKVKSMSKRSALSLDEPIVKKKKK